MLRFSLATRLLTARTSRATLVACAIAVLVLASATSVAASPPAQVAPGDLLATYELVDTYEDEPWGLRAGHVRWVRDVTSGAAGKLHALDNHYEFSAVHTVSSEGTPEAVAEIGRSTYWRRLDGGPDGAVYSMLCSYRTIDDGHSEARCNIVGFDAEGREVSSIEHVVLDKSVSDLAVGGDGRIFMAVDDRRSNTDYESSAVHILDAEGHLLSVIEAADFFQVDHSVNPHYHVGFTKLDVDPDGRIYVAYTIRTCY